MNPLQERQFDRYYASSGDPCASLKAALRIALDFAKLKMNNMLADAGGMYGNPGWATHAADLRGRLNAIRAMIEVGEMLGCDMTKEKREADALGIPTRPR